MLESEDEEVRWQAAEKLRALESSKAEDWYIARLSEEPEWKGRVRAAEALGAMRSVKAVRPLLKLENPSESNVMRVTVFGGAPRSGDPVVESVSVSGDALKRIGAKALPELEKVERDRTAPPELRAKAAVRAAVLRASLAQERRG